MEKEKVVVRFKDGRLLRGFIAKFSDTAAVVSVEDAEGRLLGIPTEELKAIFFVKSFEGDRSYRERKSFDGTGVFDGTSPDPDRGSKRGRKVYVRFHDNESVIGYRFDNPPRKRGFFLHRVSKPLRGPEEDKTGFFVLPVDGDANNTRIFIFHSAVKDIASIG